MAGSWCNPARIGLLDEEFDLPLCAEEVCAFFLWTLLLRCFVLPELSPHSKGVVSLDHALPSQPLDFFQEIVCILARSLFIVNFLLFCNKIMLLILFYSYFKKYLFLTHNFRFYLKFRNTFGITRWTYGSGIAFGYREPIGSLQSIELKLTLFAMYHCNILYQLFFIRNSSKI